MKRRQLLLSGAGLSGAALVAAGLGACKRQPPVPAAAATSDAAAPAPAPAAGAETPQIITGHTELLGLIAHPIRHSKSPRMHNLALSKLGLDYAYLCFEVGLEECAAAVQALRVLKVRGWNVSMPIKQEILKHVDTISPISTVVGACNTVVNDDGVLTAFTTDGVGQVFALHSNGIEVAGRTFTQMGCGGAGSAVAAQLIMDGAAAVDIYNRRDAFYPKAEALVARINALGKGRATLRDLADVEAFKTSVAASSVLLNTTSVGYSDQVGQSALPDASVLRPELFVSEIIYKPLKTRFMEQAEAAGCKTINGVMMMYGQGAASFKMWTGKEMPLDYVEQHMPA